MLMFMIAMKDEHNINVKREWRFQNVSEFVSKSSPFYIAVECQRLGNLQREEKLFISDSIRGWESNIKVLESSEGPSALGQSLLRSEGGRREGRKDGMEG